MRWNYTVVRSFNRTRWVRPIAQERASHVWTRANSSVSWCRFGSSTTTVEKSRSVELSELIEIILLYIVARTIYYVLYATRRCCRPSDCFDLRAYRRVRRVIRISSLLNASHVVVCAVHAFCSRGDSLVDHTCMFIMLLAVNVIAIDLYVDILTSISNRQRRGRGRHRLEG